MSFLNINDPLKRDAIVSEYLATIKRIKNRNLQERARDFAHHEALEQSLEPVVRSTAAATQAITNELLPIKEGISALNSKLQSSKHKSEAAIASEVKTDPKKEEEEEEEEKEGEEEEEGREEEPEENVFEQLIENAPADKIDEYFGIVETEDGQYKMGNKIVALHGNDITIEGTRYKGTPGLWTLIMFKKPNEELYTIEDMSTYEKIVRQTNLITSPNNLRPNSRINSTYKMREIFKKFPQVEQGEGIDFLPSDIKSLQTKLCYLLGEFRAGNTAATRNEIVAIADNLLKRKHISSAEYKIINDFIQQR